MTARVVIPVRVRVTGAVPGDAATADRVREAVARAVATACAEVPPDLLEGLAPGDVVVREPVVTAEPGHDDVLTPDVLRAAADGAGSAAAVLARPAAPVPAARTTGVPAERFDPSRRRRRGGRTTYVVPFYDGGETEVPLEEPDAAAEAPPARPMPPLPGSGEVVSLVQAYSVAWWWHVYRHGPRWDPAALGYPGYYGLVATGGRAGPTLVWITDVTGVIPETGDLTTDNRVHYLHWPMVQLTPERDARPRRRRLDPSQSGYELVPTGEPAAAEAVEARINAMIERGGYPPEFPLRVPERRREYVAALLRSGDEGAPAGEHTIWELRGGTNEALSILPVTVDGTTVLGPIRFVTAGPGAHGSETGTGEGGEGGAAGTGGTGQGTGTGSGTGDGSGEGGESENGEGGERRPPPGGVLGESEEGGRFWPVTGVDGKEMSTGPYLAEPPAADLVDEHGLVDRMNRIAARLEVPPLKYLGRFALNAAATVAGRARGVGLGAVRATSHTNVTVRPDGGGNNGFLDVRPGASPEFEYLRLLAEIAAEVSDFGNDVASCYMDPRNRHLVRVDPDWDPNAAGWALRFFGDFNDQSVNGFMHLYAETCRALLLQQLRTSRAGIVARKDQRFEQTLEAFGSALEIIGGTVVELSTLRRAIRHAGQVYRTGSVREVLSVPRTVGHGHERYELPAPIGSVAADILEILRDARIERRGSGYVAVHAGRDWTDAELEAVIGQRRGLLNQVDPLFLQIGDLDELYTGAQRDPEFLRRRLTGLLTEMLRANTEMTAESSDPDDGSFFALEASQYVEREGGRDWRGLRFELHGIHGLADDVLGARARNDARYIEGVNAAIGRKANFDRFIALFSTVGIIALGLLCAPLGAAVAAAVTAVAGLALTAYDVSEADRQEDLYRALEDPEMFLRWQEVQLAQLMAGLSIAFSVFDVAGLGRPARAIVATARQGLRVAERAGAGMAVRSVARSTRRQLLRNMTAEVLENAAKQAMTEAAVVAVMTAVLPRVIIPVLVPWIREQALLHGDPAAVEAALAEFAAASREGGAR